MRTEDVGTSAIWRRMANHAQRPFKLKDRLRAFVNLGRSQLRVLGSLRHTMLYLAGLRGTPEWLYLELTNICNANCVFCAYRYDRRKKSVMSSDLVRSAADAYAAMNGRNVGLTPLYGELFVDRRAMEKIAHTRSKGFSHIHTYTNASLLHKFGVDNILRSGLTELRLSLAPFDEEAYQKIFRFRGKVYRQLIENVRNLLIAFRATPDKTVKSLHLEFRSDRSLAECAALPDYQIHVAPYLSENIFVSAMTHFDSWSEAIKPSDMVPGMTLLDGKSMGRKRLPCHRMFAVQVLDDGTIRQCGCRVDTFAKTDELVIGHLSQTTIAKAFNSRRAKANVMSFINGRLLDVCHKCAWYDPAL